MPQVHNKLKSFDASTAFGKNSHFMNSLRFTEKSLHKVKVLNAVENKLIKKKLDFFERERINDNWKHQRIRNRLVNNLQKRIAYKFVLKNHSIINAKDYRKALDEKYTLFALHNEVNKMRDYLRPDRVRERNAKALVHENKNMFDNVVFQNRGKFNRLFPEKKTWIPRINGKLPELEPVIKEPEPTPLPTRERKAKKSLALLRRRIITLDDSKPNSPVKEPRASNMSSPLRTPSVAIQPPSVSPSFPKRQEISMTMMKKQKSFIEGKEKSALLSEDVEVIKEMESKIRKMSVEDANSETVKDDNNNEIKIEKENVQISKGSEEPIKEDVSEYSARSTKRKNSLLPPIESKKHPSSNEKTEPKTKRSEPVKLPSLKLSKKGQ